MDDISLSTLLVALIVLLVVSAFFSISETSMMALNRYRLKHLSKTGHRGARLTSQLLARTDRLLGVKDREEDPVATEDLPGLARLAVETFVLTGKEIPAPASVSGILSARAACFVTLKTEAGRARPRDLRGCIGTIEPTMQTLAEELIANAIKAATRDPRFPPVSAQEFPNLRYSVDVLAAPEAATFEELDPAIFGVIVEDEAGSSRGLLLPDIEGVDTAAKQVEIAARKAGIPEGTPLRFWRFRVVRYRENG